MMKAKAGASDPQLLPTIKSYSAEIINYISEYLVVKKQKTGASSN